jgi:hypothetical protein
MNSTTPYWLRIVGALAIAWNAIGVWSYLGYVGLVPSMGPAGATMPALITAAYATGVFAALAGSIGLLLGRRWALPLFVVSLIGLIVDWGWVFRHGAEAETGLGITVLVGAVVFVVLARLAAAKGWLR